MAAQATKGKPRFKMTRSVIKRAEEYSATGLADYQIATLLGVHARTMVELKKRHPSFEDAIIRGKTAGVGKIVNVLFEQCLTGNTALIIFWLTNRDSPNWKNKINEGIKINVENKGLAELISGINEKNIKGSAEIQVSKTIN